MSLTIDQVKKIARLSRIKMDDAEISKHCDQLNKIFGWIQQLSEVNTDAVEPLLSVNEQSLALREDLVTEPDNQEALAKLAPNGKYGYFVVPKVIE
jgi:aspartyl-tRNA(Asn)/glutamyl-tRNA(Gln) amidotransferase subunit C